MLEIEENYCIFEVNTRKKTSYYKCNSLKDEKLTIKYFFKEYLDQKKNYDIHKCFEFNFKVNKLIPKYVIFEVYEKEFTNAKS